MRSISHSGGYLLESARSGNTSQQRCLCRQPRYDFEIFLYVIRYRHGSRLVQQTANTSLRATTVNTLGRGRRLVSGISTTTNNSMLCLLGAGSVQSKGKHDSQCLNVMVGQMQCTTAARIF